MQVLGFSDYAPQAQRLAAGLGLAYGEISIHRFPDGESKVTVPTDLPEHIIICRSLNQPNDKLIELLLAASVARRQGVKRVTLVTPYLCYMRQDAVFHPGEAVSQSVIGSYLAGFCDDLVTVDPHLHRIQYLEEAVPVTNAVTVTATAALGDYLHSRWVQPLLIGPDSESEQWVKTVAESHRLDYGIANKQRLGDHEVRISLNEMPVTDRDVVMIDDMASTARTLIATAQVLHAMGARSVSALVTHALLSEETLTLMHDNSIAFIGSTDSVTHSSNVIQLAPVLADACKRLIDDSSL